MKKYTKVLAAFCAMTMIFSAFSASVFAEEIEPQTEPTVEAAEENGSEKQDENQGKDQAENLNGNQDDDQDKDQNLNDNQNEDQDQGSDTDGGVSDDANKDADGETDADTTSEDGQGAPADVNGTDDTATTEPEDPAVGGPEVPANAESTKKLLSGTRSGGVVEVDQTWIDGNDGLLPYSTGSYKLVSNISVAKSTKVETSDQNITIDLNGHTITYTGTESMYVLGRIRGTSGDNQSTSSQSPINWADCATGIVLTINGTGTITGAGTTGKGSKDYWVNGTGVGVDSTTGRGGCVLIELGSKMILNGGTITDFEANDEGGAICASNGSEFIMNGGTITNCKANKGGGAISGQCSSKQQGPQGEDICADITISGGTISNNYAGQLGGGVRINRCNLYLSGGTITNNNVGRDDGANGGGGIEIYKWDYDNVVEISGSPKVFGNKCKGNEDVNKANFYLNSGIVINLAGDLGSAADIHIGVQSTNEIVTVVNTNGKSFDIDSFKSDISSKKVHYDGSSTIVLKPDNDPKIEGYQLLIGGEIKLRAFMSLADYADSNTTVNYAYSYTKGSNTVNVAKTVNFSDLGTSGSYYTVDMPVESACITSPITVTINYGSSEQASDDPVTIEKYVKVIVHGDYAQKVKDVAWALLYFGSFAMMQFNINMNDPALRPDLEETDANINDPQPTVYQIGEGAAYTPANDPDGAFYGASVNFLSKTEVNLYFKKSVLGDTAPSMTVTYAGNETETVSATVNGSYYVYTVKGPTGDGFAATLFDVPFSFSVGNVSGEYSVDTYLQVIEYKYHGQSNNVLLLLVEKYYDFAKKCQQL